ncbi:MAG: glutaredoxin 3 [Woeseiaceae bacterium]|nr:glutaredoxin 3 [Woeseiaceae bacterium]
MSTTDPVIIYGTTTCGYCGAARMLLTKKSVEITDILITDDPSLRTEMEQRSGRRTVPQIFVGNHHVGGFDDLYALEQGGQLDKLLARKTGNLNQ